MQARIVKSGLALAAILLSGCALPSKHAPKPAFFESPPIITPTPVLQPVATRGCGCVTRLFPSIGPRGIGGWN